MKEDFKINSEKDFLQIPITEEIKSEANERNLLFYKKIKQGDIKQNLLFYISEKTDCSIDILELKKILPI
jgi:hypothetical protein